MVLSRYRIRYLFPILTFVLLWSSPFSSYSQNNTLLNKRVQLTQIKGTIEDLLDELSAVGNIKFSLNKGLTDQNKIIKINISGVHTVKEFLDEIFKETDVEYIQFNDILIIRKKTIPQPPNSTRLIKGLVMSETGEPIALALVYNKSRVAVTYTDSSGHFALHVPPDETSILFACMGFQTKEVELKDKMELKVVLTNKISSLEEVVVTGYSTQRKKEVLGAISSLKANQIDETPVASIETALQGKVSGVQVVNNSGVPGGEVMLRIRGSSSILAINRPLYIIDGIPAVSAALLDSYYFTGGGQHINFLNFINPQDIASIDILKDAASSAIYGSRGGNGIVLITTKQGKENGKLSLNFDAYHGIQSMPREYNLLNASEYSRYASEAIAGQGGTNPMPLLYTGNNTNWQKEIMRLGQTQNYNLSLSGHDSLTNYYVSGRWLDQKGIIIGSGSDNKNIHINLDRKIVRKLKIGTSLNGNRSYNDNIFEGFSPYSVYTNALLKNPNLPVYNSKGNFSDDPMGVENPVRSANEADIGVKQLRFTGTVFAELQILKNLILRSAISSDYLYILEKMELLPGLQINRGQTIHGQSREREILQMTDHTLTYKIHFKKHEMQALGGTAFQKTITNETFIQTTTNPNGTIDSSNSASKFNTNIDSYFSQINYSWSDKYLFSLSARADGTSRFSDKIKYGFFPSASIGWRVSNESFMQRFHFLNDLKLRAGYGITGNQEGLTQYNSKGVDVNFRQAGLNVSALPDLNPTWESVVQKDIGLDMTLFQNRLVMAADVYIKTSKNVLFQTVRRMDSINYGAIENVGVIENRGLDVLIQTRNMVRKFKWNTTVNISFIRNKVISLDVQKGNEDIEPFDRYPMNISSANLPGQYYGSFYGYVYLGVDPASGKNLYKDLNGDGIISEKDQTVIGRSVPKNIGGLTNSFSYKGFELHILFQWSYGNQVYNETRAVMESPFYADKYNGSKELLNYWKASGNQTDVPKPLLDSQSKNERKMSSKFVEDGSYVKLRSITLNYYFPQSITHTLKIKKLKAYFSVYNVYTLTKYTGLDPEAQNQLSRNTMMGVDSFSYPNPITFITGINVAL